MNDIITKTCTKCSENKPATLEFFNPRASGTLRADCRTCRAVSNRSWRLNNQEKVKALTKAYNAANPERIKARNKSWAAANREKAAATSRAWRAANPERMNATIDTWRANNPERADEMKRKGRRCRRAAEANTTSEPYTTQQILTLYGSDCHICFEAIDLAATRICGGPGWERGLHLDHVIPLSKGGTDLIDNIRPAHGLCNLRKGTKLTESKGITNASI